MEKLDKNNVKKILLIRNDKIGDYVFASGIMKELKKNSPRIEIGMVVSPENKNLVEKNKNISDIFVLRYRPRKLKEVFDYFKVAKQIRKKKYDVGVDLRGSFLNTFFPLVLGGVKHRVGYDRSFMAKKFLNFAYKQNSKVHTCKDMWGMISDAVDYPKATPWPDIVVGKKEKVRVDNFIRERKLKKFVCFVPDATNERLQWPLERWDEITKYLAKYFPKYKIIFTGGDMKKINWVAVRNPGTIILDSEINGNLRAVYQLFKKSNFVMSQEGGPMALAWASETKSLALRADHNTYEHTKPLGRNAEEIYRKINDISVEEVKKIISKYLS